MKKRTYLHRYTLVIRVLIIICYTFDDEDGAPDCVCVEMVFEKPKDDDNATVVCAVDVEAAFEVDVARDASQLLSALGSMRNISEYGGKAMVVSKVSVVFTVEVEAAPITEVDALFALAVIRITSS